MPEKQQNITIAIIIVLALSIPVMYFLSQNYSGNKNTNSSQNPDVLVENDVPQLEDLELYKSAEEVSAEPSPTPTVEQNAKVVDNRTMTVEEKLKTQKPQMTIDENKKYLAEMTTSEGVIKISLNAKETPITVNNFVSLSNLGFYNDVIFHRVIDGFMIQSGDPLGNGMGGPGYKFEDEKFSGEYKRGTLAMANAGPNTNGSQFFIMHTDYPLPKNYVIFGNVIEGLDVVDKIATAQVKMSANGEMSTPISPVKIISVKIVEE